MLEIDRIRRMPQDGARRRSGPPRLVLLPLLALVALAPVAQSTPIEYTVALGQPQTQMVDVSMLVHGVDRPELEFKLPTWRPGRYRIIDPAGSVRQVRASAGAGDPLPVDKTGKSTWRVHTEGAESVRLEYRIYAASLGDRTRHVDDTHAFLSGESVFMYVPERRDDDIVVEVEAPKGWHTSTGLEPHPEREGSFVAPDYDVLVDSPLEIGTQDVVEFEVDGTPHEIAIWGDVAYDAERLREDFGAIVREQAEIFGELPYDRYVFLVHVGEGMGGGTEHLNSTIMQTSPAALEEETAYRRFLGLVSHEFFHTWNVKQLRPAGIHPYDYQEENYTRLLWVAEGTTSYYDELTLVRAGLRGVDEYLGGIAGSFAALRGRPGRLAQSLEESSFDAWIKFTRPSGDDVNAEVSFYSKGALVSLLLDMEIRRATDGEATLDDVMRRMYEGFPLSGSGYTPEDLLATIEEVSGTDFDAFFDRYVRGVEELDLDSALQAVGLELYFDAAPGGRTGDGTAGELPQGARLGLELRGSRVSAVLSDGPAWEAGVNVGDEIVALDGHRVASEEEAAGLLARRQPGDVVELLLFRRDRLRRFEITLGARSVGVWRIERLDEPTEAQRRAYESWLERDWPEM